MKKLMALVAFSLIISLSFAQVQRQKKVKANTDSTRAVAAAKEDAGLNKREMMKELDLSKEQKSKIKEFRQAAQSKKAAIESDDSLKADEKQAKLKELRRELQKNTLSVLSREQKMKLLQMRNDKKGGAMEETDNQ